jgi:beta-N-acetylhexosaminidase
VKLIQAGGDIIFLPDNFEEAYQGILDAVNDGTITETRIDESVRRVLRIKLEDN